MNPKKKYYENAAQTLIEHFSKRGIEAYYAEDGNAALKTALRFVTPGSRVSWGGSMTLEEIGLIDALKSGDWVVLDRSVPKTPEEMKEFYSKVAVCDYYFMSTNAMTLQGELVNIDGNGNRVASLIFGPENVIIVAGMNKLCPDLDSAVARARNTAAPMNTVRLNKETPCTQIGRCADCMRPDCICNQFVITRRSGIPGRIKIILVGESLGY